MKIIIDTNIIFSALLNTKSTIGDLIFNSNNQFEFYSCSYMRFEIHNHWNKLLKISKLTNEQLQLSYALVLTKINFINEELIPTEIWLKSEKICELIDINDTDFVALTIFLDAILLTGDKQLYNGLKEFKFNNVVTVDELILIRNHKISN